MSKVKVQIDPCACILAANCVGIEPKLFQIGQESYVELADASGTSHGTEYTFDASDAELEMIRSCGLLSDASDQPAIGNLNPLDIQRHQVRERFERFTDECLVPILGRSLNTV